MEINFISCRVVVFCLAWVTYKVNSAIRALSNIFLNPQYLMTIKMSLDITWYRWYLLWFSQWKLDIPTFINHELYIVVPPILSCFRPYGRESNTVLDCGLHAVDSGFQLLGSGPLSVELGFRIPKPTIPDSAWKHFWTPLLATINSRGRNIQPVKSAQEWPTSIFS